MRIQPCAQYFSLTILMLDMKEHSGAYKLIVRTITFELPVQIRTEGQLLGVLNVYRPQKSG